QPVLSAPSMSDTQPALPRLARIKQAPIAPHTPHTQSLPEWPARPAQVGAGGPALHTTPSYPGDGQACENTALPIHAAYDDTASRGGLGRGAWRLGAGPGAQGARRHREAGSRAPASRDVIRTYNSPQRS